MKKLWLSLTPAHREFLIKHTPLPVGKMPYLLALHCIHLRLRIALADTILGFWPRHSFVLNSFTPFVSDLDTSLLVKDNFTKKGANKIQEILEDLRPYFPFISEINCYHAGDLPLLLSCMNPFELDRDPVLKKKSMGHSTPIPSKSLAAVFFFRMLESDWRKLLNNPKSREKKWRQHFQAVSSGLDLSAKEKKQLLETRANLPNILDLILDLLACSKEKQEKYREDLLHYFSFRQKGKEPWEIDSIPSLWSFTPQLMIHTKSSLPMASELEAHFFLGQLQWELWGIGAQFYLAADKKNYLRHLEKIRDLLEHSFPGATKPAEFQRLQEHLNILLAKWSAWIV